ncbi:MAG: hypothetical protein ABIO36_04300 [Pyrinomonadaceae bacterium]
MLFLVFVVGIAAGCGANESILKSGKETPDQANVERGKTPFASDLEAMRTAGFTFVYVLRRNDGAQMDSEDRSVIKLNTADANRRVAADENRAVIVGSNFQISAKNMGALYARFAIDNYSQEPPPIANKTGNVNN